MELPDSVKNISKYFLNRGGQILASVVAMMTAGSCYAGPAVTRTMFELSLQFEYLMKNPATRAKQYREYAHVTRHRLSQAIARNPTGPISQQIAGSPLRPEGEKRNQAEYDQIKEKYQKGKTGKEKLWENWYRMTIHDLAKEICRDGEYRVVYAFCSSWAHGDPLSTQSDPRDIHTFAHPKELFIYCVQCYGRMLLKIVDTGKVTLGADQYEALKKCSEKIY